MFYWNARFNIILTICLVFFFSLLLEILCLRLFWIYRRKGHQRITCVYTYTMHNICIHIYILKLTFASSVRNWPLFCTSLSHAVSLRPPASGLLYACMVNSDTGWTLEWNWELRIKMALVPKLGGLICGMLAWSLPSSLNVSLLAVNKNILKNNLRELK